MARAASAVRNRSLEIDLLAPEITFGAVAVHPGVLRQVFRFNVEFVERTRRQPNENFLTVVLSVTTVAVVNIPWLILIQLPR